MLATLQSMIKDIEARIKAEDPTALDDASKLVEQYPDEPQAWHVFAYANSRRRNYSAAITAITREMALRPARPALHFTRGGYSLMVGDYASAIADFTEGLALGNHLEREPYREVLHFLRAEAFYQLGRKVEALADLEHVEDDCTFWTVQVRSKAELLVLCGESVPPSGADDVPRSSEPLDYGGNLLVENRAALTEFPNDEESALAKNLGDDGLAAVDAALIKHVIDRYLKAARVIWNALEFGGHSPNDKIRIRLYARQLIALAVAGRVVAQGDLHMPRFSEVRLPDHG